MHLIICLRRSTHDGETLIIRDRLVGLHSTSGSMALSCRHSEHAPPVTSSRLQRLCCPLQPCRPSSPSTLARWAGAAFTPFAGCRAAPLSSRTAPTPQRRANGFTTSAESPQSSGSGRSGGGEPQLSADAISAGLKAYQSGDHESALELFQQALTLPGTGLKRYRCVVCIQPS